MFKTVLSFLSENRWYVIAGVILSFAIGCTYGMQSKCPSLVQPGAKINRAQLQNELHYIIGQAKCYEADLDKQDAVKQSLLDAANILSTTGTINPSGLLNLAASIGGISFGLSQRKRALTAEAKKSTNSA
jgi:hypothetical protein